MYVPTRRPPPRRRPPRSGPAGVHAALVDQEHPAAHRGPGRSSGPRTPPADPGRGRSGRTPRELAAGAGVVGVRDREVAVGRRVRPREQAFGAGQPAAATESCSFAVCSRRSVSATAPPARRRPVRGTPRRPPRVEIDRRRRRSSRRPSPGARGPPAPADARRPRPRTAGGHAHARGRRPSRWRASVRPLGPTHAAMVSRTPAPAEGVRPRPSTVPRIPCSY